MHSSSASLRRSPFLWMWVVTGAVFAAKALFIFLTPTRLLATTIWIIDDAFIEMRVSRNIALGLGFSYDGMHATTGSPFLWTYICALPHLFLSKDAAVQATILLSTLSGALACAVVFALARRLTGRTSVAWTAFLLATFCATAFTNAMNGMETAFFTLFALLTVGTSMGLGKPNSCPWWAWGIVTGLCGGITLMTRADGIFLLAPILLFQLLDLASSARKLERSRLLQQFGGMVAALAVCFGIFMAWQILRTGTPFPANQVGRRELAFSLHGFSSSVFSWSHYARVVAWNVFQIENLLRIAMGSSLLAFFAGVYALFRPELRRYALFCLLYCSIFFGMLAAYQWYFPDFHGLRYLNPTIHFLFILTAALLWSLPEHRYRTHAVAVAMLVILIVSGYLHYQLASRMPWGHDESYIARASDEQLARHWRFVDWMRDNLPAGTVVGVRDHGRVALFSDLPIQDLAGNIDPAIPLHVKDGTLRQYLRAQNVSYMLLPDPNYRKDLLYQVIFRDFTLEPVEAVPPGEDGGLYKINWAKTLPDAA